MNEHSVIHKLCAFSYITQVRVRLRGPALFCFFPTIIVKSNKFIWIIYLVKCLEFLRWGWMSHDKMMLKIMTVISGWFVT